MERKVIHTSHAPQAVGTYSQAVAVDRMVFISGQLGIDPASGNLANGFDAQAHQVFRNLRAVCAEAGGEHADRSGEQQ
jgi:enamine deaminase RidA (YjgF/YER057c/UK114 family)